MSCAFNLLPWRLLQLEACCQVFYYDVCHSYCFSNQMLVEYDVLARDHQDANVSFCFFYFILILSVVTSGIFFTLTGKRGGNRQNNGHIMQLGAGFEIYWSPLFCSQIQVFSWPQPYPVKSQLKKKKQTLYQKLFSSSADWDSLDNFDDLWHAVHLLLQKFSKAIHDKLELSQSEMSSLREWVFNALNK